MGYKQKKNGYTLIELVLVCSIFAIIVASVGSIILSTTKGYNKFFDLATLENEAIFLENEMADIIKPAKSIHILENIPSIMQEDSAYIYSNGDSILYKAVGQQPFELYNPYESIQNITFNSENDDNILVSVNLEQANASFDYEFSIPILNDLLEFSNDGQGSKCLAFSLGEGEGNDENPYIVSFDLYKSDNSDLEKNCIGIIDHENGTINIETSLTDITSLTPRIKIVGDSFKISSPNGSIYNIDNPVPLNFENVKNVYVLSGDIFKQYIINVTKKQENQEIDSGTLNIIPTETKYSSVDDSYYSQPDIEQKDICMPNNTNYLNARFQYDKNIINDENANYYVRWYAVDSEDVSSVNDISKLYNDGKLKPFETVQNKRYINLDNYVEDVSGKYVFFDVYLNEKTNVLCSLDNQLQNDVNTNGLYGVVFVGLKNGEIFETTLNELDFLYSNTYKQQTILSSFNRLSPNKKGYYIFSENKAYNDNIEDVSYFIDNCIKVIAPYKNQSHDFDVDFINKEVTITGSSSQLGSYNDHYPKLNSSEYSQNGLFSVNMYDNYYSDKRSDYNSSGSTIRFAFSNDVQGSTPEIGGVYIAPNAYSELKTFGDENYIETYGYNINYTYNKSNNFKDGINMNYSVGSKINGNYIESNMETISGKVLIGATDVSRGNSNRIAYSFDQIKKEGFSINPSETNSITMEINTQFEKPNATSPYYTLIGISLCDSNDSKLKSYPLYFGHYEYFTGNTNYVYGDNNEYSAKLAYDDNKVGSQSGENGTSYGKYDPVAFDSKYMPPYNYTNNNIDEKLLYTTIGTFGYKMNETKARITITDLTTNN